MIWHRHGLPLAAARRHRVPAGAALTGSVAGLFNNFSTRLQQRINTLPTAGVVAAVQLFSRGRPPLPRRRD
jgi:hypothetical protein